MPPVMNPAKVHTVFKRLRIQTAEELGYCLICGGYHGPDFQHQFPATQSQHNKRERVHLELCKSKPVHHIDRCYCCKQLIAVPDRGPFVCPVCLIKNED